MRLRAAVPVEAVLTAAILLAGFGFCLAINLPGHLSYDSVIQLLEGRTARYGGWHPPFMSWLLGVLDGISRGTALFVILNMGLFFTSLLSLVWLVKKPSWTAATAAALCLLTPQVLLYQGIVWKDVLFANEGVAAFVCLTLAVQLWANRPARFVLLAAAFSFFVLCALTRQNGIVLLPFGALALGVIASCHTTRKWRDGSLYGLGAFAVAALVLSAANVALGMRLVNENGAIRQFRLLETYDLIGALAVEPGYQIPDVKKIHPEVERELRSDGVRLYSPERNDPLGNSQKLQDALSELEDDKDLLANSWRDLVFHHPLLYLRIRADVFRWVFLTPDLKMCLPVFDGVSGPAPEMAELGLQPRDDARDDALDDYAGRFIGTPVLSHPAFAFLALIELVLLLRRRRDADIAIGAMLIGAFAFTASFFAISIACDYRYLYFPDLAALTALFYLSLDPSSLWRGRAAVAKEE